MKLVLKIESGILYQGFSQNILNILQPETVDCVITSPPYFGLRDYSNETIQIFDGNKKCENHNWTNYKGKFDKKNNLTKNTINQYCIHCNAFKCQLGLEPIVELYIDHLVSIFEKIKVVLKNSGTCFINIGDTYLDDGNLGMVPYRLAFTLRKSGWFLRNIITWNKRYVYKTDDSWLSEGKGLPESVDNRFSKSTEVVLFLTKRKTGYFFDVNALKIGWKEESIERLMRGVNETHKYAKLPLYGGGEGLNRARLHVKKYKGKVVDEEINKNSFYRFYDRDEGEPEVAFVYWFKNQIKEKGIEKQLDEIFTRSTWSNWIRTDRISIMIPTVEQWNVVKKLLNITDTPFDWLIRRHGFKRPTDSVFINPQARSESHFATMPDNLIYYLLVHGCPENGVVLDPFAGICSTAIIAHRNRRRWICIEPVSTFVEIAVKKIQDEVRQKQLL